MEKMWWYIITPVIIIVALSLVMFGPFKKAVGTTSKTTESTIYSALIEKCKVDTQQRSGDIDLTDGLLISCQRCIGGPDIDEQGKIIDEDNDGLADACDEHPKNPGTLAEECKGVWDDKLARCCLKGYEKYCAVS